MRTYPFRALKGFHARRDCRTPPRHGDLPLPCAAVLLITRGAISHAAVFPPPPLLGTPSRGGGGKARGARRQSIAWSGRACLARCDDRRGGVVGQPAPSPTLPRDSEYRVAGEGEKPTARGRGTSRRAGGTPRRGRCGAGPAKDRPYIGWSPKYVPSMRSIALPDTIPSPRPFEVGRATIGSAFEPFPRIFAAPAPALLRRRRSDKMRGCRFASR